MGMREVSFGRYLRLLRESKKKTLRGVARYLKISAAYLSDVELGRRGPLAWTQLSAVLNVLEASEMERLALLGLARLQKLERTLELLRRSYDF